MPQQQEIYDNFTGEEFLWYMAALKGLEKKYAKNKIDNLLKVVNLTSEKNKKNRFVFRWNEAENIDSTGIA